MSWTNELYKIYDQNCGRTDCAEVLLPVSHSTANAQILVTVDEAGNFVSASKVDKSDAVTIIPVTEASGTRTAEIAPHPLADKLLYIAGDYPEYTSVKRSDNSEYYGAYMNALKNWCESKYSHDSAYAIYEYLCQATLIKDLISARVLEVDETTGKLKDKVKIEGIAQEDCFVRFRVNYNDISRESVTWRDKTLYDSFTEYNAENMGTWQLCYATGEVLPCTYKHPIKIRNAGDRAKLISSNDESGFAYRGRFADKNQALSVSYDFSQKMHNALKWLIARQGKSIENSLMLLVWESSLADVPDITANLGMFDVFGDTGDSDEADGSKEKDYPDTMPAFKKLLSDSIFGYKSKLASDSKVMVMAFDSATTGRLAISMYTELAGSDFYNNIEKWHNDTAWKRFNGKLRKKVVDSFSLYDIIECAYGTEQGKFIKCKDKVICDTLSRLIPCVIEGRKIPRDIVSALVAKASNPIAYNESYNWRRTLETACGMIRKEKIDHYKGDCEMSLDKECGTRDYLYGRLIAIADAAESSTFTANEERVTNARRYFNAFSNRPCYTWNIIHNRLIPYINKMPEKTRIFYTKLIQEVESKFTLDDFRCDSKLKPEFLHAYYCQLEEIYKGKNKEE